MARRVVLYCEKYTPQPAHVQLGTSVTEGLSLAMQIIQLQMLFAHTTDYILSPVCPGGLSIAVDAQRAWGEQGRRW